MSPTYPRGFAPVGRRSEDRLEGSQQPPAHTATGIFGRLYSAPSPRTKKLNIRLAQPEDFDDVATVFCQAFINDPVINYLGSATKVIDQQLDAVEWNNKKVLFLFLIKGCFLTGGRVTTVVDDSASSEDGSSTSGKIVAAAIWLPPNKRLSIWMLPTIMRAGFIGVVRAWGWKAVWKTVIDYQGTSESRMDDAFRKRGTSGSPDNSWYLESAAVEPKYQGQGLLSLLVREGFENAPNEAYTLEVTTKTSRDQYIHLGFENLTSIHFGQGKANPQGISALGADAIGIEIWGMAKLPNEVRQGENESSSHKS